MTRIKVLTRDEMNAEQRAAFDDAKAAGAPTGGPYTAYIRMPALMRATRVVSDILRGSALTGRERQMAVLIAIRHWDANYPWAVQVRASLAAGLDQTTIDKVGRTLPPVAAPENPSHATAPAPGSFARAGSACRRAWRACIASPPGPSALGCRGQRRAAAAVLRLSATNIV